MVVCVLPRRVSHQGIRILFMVLGLGFGVTELGLRFRVYDLGLGTQRSGRRVQGLGFQAI